MEFAYSPRLAELKERARALTEKIIPFEDECERNNGISRESHASIKASVLESGLQAINTPIEWGGAGLTVLEQVVVQDSSASSPTRCGTWSGARRTRCDACTTSSASAT